jgi:hypothetical protein
MQARRRYVVAPPQTRKARAKKDRNVEPIEGFG